MSAKVIRLPLQLSYECGHVRVGEAMSRLTMDVVAKVGASHHEDRDVGQRAHVCELLELVLYAAVIQATPKNDLNIEV
jgi:hypothetical protein